MQDQPVQRILANKLIYHVHPESGVHGTHHMHNFGGDTEVEAVLALGERTVEAEKRIKQLHGERCRVKLNELHVGDLSSGPGRHSDPVTHDVFWRGRSSKTVAVTSRRHLIPATTFPRVVLDDPRALRRRAGCHHQREYHSHYDTSSHVRFSFPKAGRLSVVRNREGSPL